MALADEHTERWRRRFGMSRRDFVRTAAATAIGLWAIDAVGAGRFGRYLFGGRPARAMDACDLEFDAATGTAGLANLPGEFIFDVQTHHVDPDGLWRVDNPVIHAFFAAVWPQAREGGDFDPIQNLSRSHYLKELFLDSATTMTVLSCVPTGENIRQPLPIGEAFETCEAVNHLAGSQRAVMHSFAMPNRGFGGHYTKNLTPLHMLDELDQMLERATKFKSVLRGWKTYPAWGDVPYASGWFLDSTIGDAFLAQVEHVSAMVPEVPPVVATHKGFALPAFDQKCATPRDVGPAARRFPGVRIVVYHSGFDDGDYQQPYPGDYFARDDVHKVDALIKSLRTAQWDASRHGGNSPNVFAELGSVWRNVMHDPDQAAHLLGKLITHVGPKRVVHGTDSLWYGSPQPEIAALRAFEFTDEGKALYNLPHGLEGDVEDPRAPAPTPARTIRNGILGRNAALAYGIDPDARRNAISCDAVASMRQEGYLADVGTPRERAPLASNELLGARTRREFLMPGRDRPWAP
jgi:uncharacterized protein